MGKDNRTPPLRASSRDTLYFKSSPEKGGDFHVTTCPDVLKVKVPTSTWSGSKIFLQLVIIYHFMQDIFRHLLFFFSISFNYITMDGFENYKRFSLYSCVRAYFNGMGWTSTQFEVIHFWHNSVWVKLLFRQ